ncbi:hypothetical protein KAU86_01540 [bacterium]|nr:hypothetical protein [bacterium]
MEINYFGKPYSFTHVAALRRFGKKHKYVSMPTIGETIDAVIAKPDSISVIPIENTAGGIIHDTVDILCMEECLESDLIILEELELLVRLFLLSKKSIKLSQVKRIYSHEYALKRAEDWIKKHMPHTVDLEQIVSTSEAVHRIQKEKYSCAIASSEAARYYGLRKLKEITVEGKKNLTRFFVLGKNGNSKRRI